MEIPGRFHRGVVVLEHGSALPEGATVTVTYSPSLQVTSPAPKRRIQIPLVRTNQPGSVSLTGEQIAAILDQEDASPGH